VGFVHVEAEVRHPSGSDPCRGLDFLVDTGALLCQLPRSILEGLGSAPQGTRGFRSFDGPVVERKTDSAAAAEVVFGDEKDCPPPRVMAWEALGCQVEPVTGELNLVEPLLL
jgi:predicted aspartyl protease